MITPVLWLILTAAQPSGQIAYVSGTEQEDQCVCVLDVAEKTVVRAGPGKRDQAPVWSPDGEWLAFETAQPEGIGIYLVRSDGSEGRLISPTHKWNRWPSWSPDSDRLAYSATASMDGESGMAWQVVVYDLATSTEKIWAADHKGLMRPVWIPGTKLLEGLSPDQFIDLGDVQLDMKALSSLTVGGALLAIGLKGSAGGLGTDIFAVTEERIIPLPPFVMPSSGEYNEWAAQPSPDGDAIAFESDDGGDREIFVLKKGSADVSNHRAADWNPVWSPDGEWIAFESFRNGRRGVYRVYTDTARVSVVAAEADADNWAPTWSPGAEWIAYVSDRTGSPEIFLADVHGEKAPKRLTDNDLNDYAPAWRPKPKGKK